MADHSNFSLNWRMYVYEVHGLNEDIFPKKIKYIFYLKIVCNATNEQFDVNDIDKRIYISFIAIPKLLNRIYIRNRRKQQQQQFMIYLNQIESIR